MHQSSPPIRLGASTVLRIRALSANCRARMTIVVMIAANPMIAVHTSNA
jgi:hypothetical protein